MKLLGRKDVDRKLGVEPSGQRTGRGNKGKNRGKRGIKQGENRGAGKGERGMKEGAWGKVEGRGLITQVEDEGEGHGKVALY